MQTYELGLTRIGKTGKGKNMALKAKSSDTDESLDDEDSKMLHCLGKGAKCCIVFSKRVKANFVPIEFL